LFWYIFTGWFSTLPDVMGILRQSRREQELELLLLRQPVRILQHQLKPQVGCPAMKS
jgi:hypothetical protein